MSNKMSRAMVSFIWGQNCTVVTFLINGYNFDSSFFIKGKNFMMKINILMQHLWHKIFFTGVGSSWGQVIDWVWWVRGSLKTFLFQIFFYKYIHKRESEEISKPCCFKSLIEVIKVYTLQVSQKKPQNLCCLRTLLLRLRSYTIIGADAG